MKPHRNKGLIGHYRPFAVTVEGRDQKKPRFVIVAKMPRIFRWRGNELRVPPAPSYSVQPRSEDSQSYLDYRSFAAQDAKVEKFTPNAREITSARTSMRLQHPAVLITERSTYRNIESHNAS